MGYKILIINNLDDYDTKLQLIYKDTKKETGCLQKTTTLLCSGWWLWSEIKGPSPDYWLTIIIFPVSTKVSSLVFNLTVNK